MKKNFTFIKRNLFSFIVFCVISSSAVVYGEEYLNSCDESSQVSITDELSIMPIYYDEMVYKDE